MFPIILVGVNSSVRINSSERSVKISPYEMTTRVISNPPPVIIPNPDPCTAEGKNDIHLLKMIYEITRSS